MALSQRERLQRATWGHQNPSFCTSEGLVLVGKTQFLSRSERHSRSDVGDVGRAGKGAGSWKTTKRRRSGEYQNEHRAFSLPVGAMPSSGRWDPALRTPVPRHQLDNPRLPVPHWEIRDWDPCFRVRSCKTGGGGLGQSRQGTGCPGDVKAL